ncbi:family 1 glycosylhydrolase [Planococcus sp. APC 4015]|nr:family 1 glycosylhydrolase [Planococcus sp. APC 4015]
MSRAASFPAGFLWGVGTSAHQYDGNNAASDYWELENSGIPLFAERSGDAIDSYRRWPDDIRLAADLGLNAYRLSIEWARLEPVRGHYSFAERERYRDMIRCCRENGLEPLIVLQHITHPSWFSRAGGWAAPDSGRAFTEYVRFLTPILEDVRYVATMNEPNILSTLGGVGRLIRSNDPAGEYAAISAQHPTQRGLLGAATAAIPDERIVEGLTRAHTAARSVLREETDAQVGWTVSIQPVTAQPGFEDEAAVITRHWVDPFLEVSRGDDWVGVQTYTSWMVGPQGAEPRGSRRTQLGWAFQPDAVGDALRQAGKVVGEVPLLVTENGVATADDTERVEYLDGATTAIAHAVGDGLNVLGYFHWTFMDNFEWVSGFEVSFGLVSVDRETFTRTPKRSALWLEQFARAHHSATRE